MLPELWQHPVPATGPGHVQDPVVSTVPVPGLRVLVQEPDQPQGGHGVISGNLTGGAMAWIANGILVGVGAAAGLMAFVTTLFLIGAVIEWIGWKIGK